jgi:hypothetical protein
MKLGDLERVNHLVSELEDIKLLIDRAERSDPAAFEVIIEAGGDGGMKLSAEGTSTAHSQGIDVTAEFLEKLKRLALEELQVKQQRVIAELTKLGVEN